MVTTLAGNGTNGVADGRGILVQFSSPQGVAIDAFGNVFVADTYAYRIRKIDSSGRSQDACVICPSPLS